MSDPKKNESGPKKVFFITSNQSKLDKLINYDTPKNKGLINLRAGDKNSVYRDQRNFKREQFSVFINCMDISPKDLDEKDKDPKNFKYKGQVTLKFNSTNFPGPISFIKSKNNFIYDFEFKEYKGWGRIYDPPPRINLSKLDQLKLYIKYMKVLQKHQDDQIYKELIADSQKASSGKKIKLDFYLEIFKNCYTQKEVKIFLKKFELENILLPENFAYKEYVQMLKIIERSPKIIIKHCRENEDTSPYYINFYTLLLYTRFNYERENALQMLEKKDLWEYLIKILPDKANFFPKLPVSYELINKMFEQKLTVKIITGILSFCGSVEKILALINEKIKLISNCCIEEKKEIIMSTLENPQKTDNIEMIIEEINKIITYEMEYGKRFISFDEDFWKNYIQFNDEVKKLFMINKAIILCTNIDKKLKIKNMNLEEKIHKNGLDSIKKGHLRNETLIEFINIDIYFSDYKYANKYYRPMYIVNGLDFDNMTEEFFGIWNSSSIFKIYSFADNNFKSAIVEQVTDMKNFGKLLKLFNYKDKNILDYNLLQKLREKFKSILDTYKADTCPKFVEDIAYYIYIIDYQKSYNIQKFMTDTIEKFIPSVDLKKDIYIYLATNYKDITNDAINGVTDFLTKNKDRLNAKSILFLLNKINSKNIIESLLNKIESFTIKEEELFSPEKEFESFELLKGYLEDKLYQRFENLENTKYLMNALQNKDNIFNKIQKGEINFNSFKGVFFGKEKKDNFKEKLKILFFNDEDYLNKSISSMETRMKNIMKEFTYILSISQILKEFFANEKKNDIVKVERLNNLIKSGNLNEIEKPDVKKILEEIHNIIPQEEFEHKKKLKDSIFFVQLFRTKKKCNPFDKESEIFQKAEDDFGKLKLLFESENWINDIPESIIKICFNVLKQEKKNKLLLELGLLMTIFGIKYANADDKQLKIKKLEKNITTYNQKEDIFLTANSCIHFIDELEAIQTDFYKELDKIRQGLQANINLMKIESFGKTMEKYGLKVLNPKEEDRNYLNILHCIYAKKGSVKFIANLEDNDIRNLQEIVTMSDDTFVTNNEIQDMIKCSNFIHNLLSKEKKTDEQLIKDFINEVPKIKGIEAHFQNYTNNAGEIQDLFSKKLDKSKATLQRIRNIMKGSSFTLSIDNTRETYLNFEGILTMEEKINADSTINYEDIIELRERAMLTRKLGDDKSKEEKEIFNLYKLFSERVAEIEKINQLLKKLGEKGYSENIKIIIDINNNESDFSIDYKRFKNYEDCSKYLDELFLKITDIQTKYYKNEELIRFVYGRQFNLLNACLRKERNNALVPFLQFLTNDQISSKEKLQNLNFGYDYELNRDDKYICLFENIKKFLTDFLIKNNLTLETIYKQNIIQEKYREKFVGFFTYLLEDDKIGQVQKGIEEHILNWFKFLTGNPPMAQTVLLCNEETTSEEITAFMYRAFLCQYPVFFMVGKIELLTSEKRQTLTRLINALFINRAGEMKSCVAFAYTKSMDSIVLYLERIKGKKNLEHDEKKKQQEESYEENVEIISSDKAGVGKSTKIKAKIKAKNKKYIHFPFGGEFSRKDVINRLKKIQNQITKEERTVIHLDLYDSKQTELMKDFLYSFLITKLYGQNEDLFYLSKKVEIVIEIPCGFVNFFNKFPLLSMFKNKTEMKIAELPPLIIKHEIDSNIQIVCNYLKLLKSGKLSDTDLIIDKVSLTRDDIEVTLNRDLFKGETYMNAVSLNEKECDTLIKDYFKKELKIEFPTYYQINSFINVLSGQLKKFSMNFGLTAGNLIQSGIALGDPNLKKLREIMVNSFIKNTIHFTQGAFDKILTSQIETYSVGIEQGAYNEDKQEEIAIKALSNPGDIISCDKIDPALVFFHEGEGQEFTIITKDKPNQEEYNKLLQLRKSFVILQNEIYKSYGKNDQIEEVPKELKHYTKFKHQQFLEEIKQIFSLRNPVYTADKGKNIEGAELKSIEEIVGEYVFTADNFIKMILILLRIRENIPVIMMGETGCGKTSLIRKLSELLNNGESIMEIMNIHAGITDEEIVKFLFENKEIDGVKYDSIIEKAEKLEKKEEATRKLYEEKKQKYFKKKLWVFLDEINTCNCMGLICELMTKHTCQGVELPENIFFIGACNPYRYNTKTVENYALKLAGTKEKKLVYTVNPLPFSLLNFVFNFGNLTSEDEKSYINNMVVSPIESFFWKEVEAKNKEKKDFVKKDLQKQISADDFKLCEELKTLSAKAIIEAQNFVRDKNEVSSVSLREIRRFSIFYEFFVEYFRNNKKLAEKRDQKEYFNIIDNYYSGFGKREIYINSIKLSIYLCYYMRLSKKEYRRDLAVNKMNPLFGDNFVEVPEHEQQFIANNIEMKAGIAKNRALLENLFTIFACVNAKIPLFIVGKPGCSKSLSVQLLFGAMKGDASDNLLFKSLPKLFINSYQGSLGSTSKGVLNIFKKARLLLKTDKKNNDIKIKNANNIVNNNNLEKIISMIYFDEMGLAEHSPNNPLKVIHSELEYDLNEGSKKIAFVGISNWILDASKMNRGLFLSIPTPDQEDLQITAKTIAESYNDKLAKDNKDLFDALANTYFEYKEILQKQYTIKEDFHGSRDFYHLIKTSMRQIMQKKEEDINLNIDENQKQEIGINSIERNFAGLEIDPDQKGGVTSLELIKKQFKKRFVNCDVRKEYNVLKTICDNIKDKESRYLLLISKSSISNYLLNSILTSPDFKKDLDKELSFYIGSGFTKDIHSEGYGLKILNKIQLQMEQNKILLLADLEAVYPSLYDLFNQNFTVVSKKNYARIAMGSTNNTFSLVNDGFKCIVLVDDKSLEKQMPPFLNRFEKHVISFEYLLTEEFIKQAKAIYELIQDFAKIHLKESKLKIKYNLKDLLINCDEEEIRGIIYSKISEYQKKGEKLLVQDLQDLVLEKIALTLPQDIIFLLKHSGFEQVHPKIADKIIDFYQKGEHRNLYNFLKTMENTKNVIYTFTSIDEPLLANIKGEFDTKLLGKIDKNVIQEIQISSLSTENELEAQLEKIYLGEGKRIKIAVFKFNPYETSIMNYVKFFIENHIKEKNYIDENNKKVFIFSVHMNRILLSDETDKKKRSFVRKNKLVETISHLSDFYQIFIDNLNGEDYSITDLMKCKEEELFNKCLKMDKEFKKSIYGTFSYFNYNFSINIKGIEKNNYPKKVMNFLMNNEEFAKLLINCVLKKPTTKIDIGQILNKNEYFTRDDVGIISVVQRYLSTLFKDNINKLIFKLEKDNFLSTFIYNQLYTDDNKIQPKDEQNKKEELVKEINLITKDEKENKNEIKEEKIENKENKNEIKENKNEIKEEKIETKEDKNEIKEENKENEKKDDKEKKGEDIQEGQNEQLRNYYLNNNLVKVLIETYLDTVNFSINSIKKNIKDNKVSLLLGLRLPGIYITLKEIIKYIKNEVKNKYLNTEKKIRNLREEAGHDFGRELDEIKKSLRSYQKNCEIEILKNKIFSKLNSVENLYQKDSHEFYDLLMNDYYLIFLSENLPDINEVYQHIDEYKNILKLMIHERFNTGDEGEEINPIRAVAKKILWVESYSQYISILLNIYRKISEYEKDLFNKMEKPIKNGEFILEEEEDRNPHHTIELKSPFYYITESLLRISVDEELFSKLQGQKFYDYINLLKTITKDSLVINSDLSIYSKEIFTIQEFLEIEEGLNNVNKSNVENIIIVLGILSEISKINNQRLEISRQGKDLSDNIIKLYDFLFNNLGDTEKFRELVMGIFVRESRKVKNDNYRTTLIEIMLKKNNNLIVYSYPLMSMIMNEFLSSEPEDMGNNIKNFQDNTSKWLELINNANNEVLNQILLAIFEKVINIFFESIPDLSDEKLEQHFKKYYDEIVDKEQTNETFILSDRSLELFKECAILLETIYNNRKEKKVMKNELLCELYAIAFIKIYIFKYVYFSHFKNQEFIYFEEVLNAINGNANTEVRQMIKIYAFKVFFYLLGNYQDFINYNYKNHQINFFDDLKERFVEKKEAMLSFYMLPNVDADKLKIFKEYFEKFDTYRFAEFNKSTNEFVNYINNNGIDSFYMISTDLIVSNLALQNYVKDFNDYTKYSSYTKNVFSDQKIKLPEITKKLFFLYSNDEAFNNTMKKKFLDEQNLKEINVNQFEILLYALRFCLQSSNCQNPNGLLYSQLITPDCEKKFNENCIPGNNILDNIFVKSYNLLENHLIIENKASNIGAYVCGCGLYYSIGPCGFPNAPGICMNCKKKIGYDRLPPGITGGHGFAHVKGHYRIFKDQAQKLGEFAKYGDNDRNIPNMYIADYKKTIIDPILEKDRFGISKVTKVIFEDVHQKVRKLSTVGYRLLNFIAYSHLFYANCLGFISNENVAKYICDGMTLIQMLEKDWNLIKDALQSKGIQIIQIFMNFIFDKLSEKIKNCKEIKTTEEREKFEDEIEKLLEESYKGYEAYSKIYTENNEKMLELDKNSMKSLVLENNDINAYDEKDYPFYKYFIMTTYPSKESFINELKKVDNYQRKYPLLNNYIKEDNKEKFLLKYLPEFNEFSNFMIDYYSYKISREDAAKKVIKEEELYKNDYQKFQTKLKNFSKIWKKLKPHAIKYGCRDEMPPVDLNENQFVAYFLNDNGDLGKGMYIAAAYENFIEWQNNFLDSLIEPLKQNGILHHYVKNMEQTIDVQKAKKNEALNFDIVNKNFTKYIYENCKRNIFRKDNSINYMNYKQFIYDFDSIEKYLGELLLPGKVKFNSYEKLKFVTFCFEGFRGNKTSVLTDFADKYKQVPLNLANKQIIYDIIKEKFNGQHEELSNILFSIQLLIYYLTQERQNEKDEIKTIIDELPDYVNLSRECKEFLQEPNLKIKSEDLIGIYSFFEFLCFKPIINNLQEHYKKEIDENTKKKVLSLFDEKKFKIITKKTLATACRKFISRYLVSSRQDTDFDENKSLSDNLARYEFWPEEAYLDDDAFNNELNYLKNEKIITGQCFELYNLLGGDETDELRGIKVKKEEEKEEEDEDDVIDDDDDDGGKIKNRRRKKN